MIWLHPDFPTVTGRVKEFFETQFNAVADAAVYS